MNSIEYLAKTLELINLGDNINIKARLIHLKRHIEEDLEKSYTTDEAESFSEWCVYNCIRYNGGWLFKYSEISSLNIKTTEQLREIWEKDERRKK